jgi:cytochrome c oxidase cbb3-type subunit III
MKTRQSSLLILLSLAPVLGFSQGQILSGETNFSNPLFNTLLGVIIFLLIVIVAMTQVLKNIAQSDIVTRKRNEEKNNTGTKVASVALFSLFAFNASAANGSTNDWLVGGLDYFTFFFMIGVITLEVIFLLALFRTLKGILAIDKPVVAPVVKLEKKEKSIIEKLNASVEIEREEEIMMDHEYDGIRELDNDLPPWWRYGFYLTILVSVVYMIHYHIADTGDLQLAEYNKEVELGKMEVEAYMKNAANNVDETTVKMLEGADLENGKTLFISNCGACHGKQAEGGVGPNLADNYWMHGGSISDIFKSIKYGWADKGMKAWKEDFSPVQIAQITSYIKSIAGINPPNGKAPQGDLYEETPKAPNDSLAVKDPSK